jgi:hypothetical protein
MSYCLKINHDIKIFILKYKSVALSTDRTQRKLKSGHQFATTGQDVLKF